MAFVTNGGWLDANAADGMRKCLAEEFTRIDVFHLRGNQRTQGDLSRREGGKIFGQGSRAPVAITVMSLNKRKSGPAIIRFHDIGDYLSREQKLAKITAFGSVGGISRGAAWSEITPDQHGDWLGQRDESFGAYIPIADNEKNGASAIFDNYSLGVVTNRDAWCVNPSRSGLLSDMATLIQTYEEERERLVAAKKTFASASERQKFIDNFVTIAPQKICWTHNLKGELAANRSLSLDAAKATHSAYRPFTRAWLYFDRKLNERVFQMPKLFPDQSAENRIITLPGPGEERPFSVLMGNVLPDLHMIHGGRSFPQYLYEEVAGGEGLFSNDCGSCDRRDGISDKGLKHFADAYPGEAITKDDLFYFVYGILHSPDYRDRYADNLRRQLPRMPILKRAEDFWAFVEAGRKLGDLHVNYESVDPYAVSIGEGDLRLANIDDPVSYFRVEKMKFAGKRPKLDKTTVIYNPRITITNIPLAAYEYVVNGKPALEWVMERQCVSTDPASGIVNDANAYANETVGDPRYPFDLFCRIITVSLETMKIVKSLPALEIRESGEA